VISKIDAGELLLLAPILWLALGAIAALFADILVKRRSKVAVCYTALVGVFAAGYCMLSQWYGSGPEQIVLAGSVGISSFGCAAGLAILAAAAGASLSAAHYAEGSAVATGEFHALVLFSAAGALTLVIANDLVTFFVALETMSIAVYGLTGIARRRSSSSEAAMKYFVLGAFASGFLLYGIGLLYGATGTLQLFARAGEKCIATSQGVNGWLAFSGVGCMLVGLLFKVGGVPFHSWVPDAYEGAPAPSTAFMSVAIKAAALAAFMKLVIALGQGSAGQLQISTLLWYVALASMIVGNFGALMQRSPKRMLAYSGIAHTGYALVAVVVVAAQYEHGADQQILRDAVMGLLFYLVAYGLTNLAVFGLLCSLEREGGDIRVMEDLSGLGKRSPAIALCMLVALLSLAGLPLTGGFTAKVMVFKAGLSGGFLGLVLLGLFTSVVSLYYYLRPVVLMFMEEERGSAPVFEEGRWGGRLTLVVGVAGTLWLGLMPGPMLALAKSGAVALITGG